MKADPVRQPPARRAWWTRPGVILAIVVAIFGLALLAYVIILFVALASYGSNK